MDDFNSKLERNRKPRVHIKYEVETEDATTEKELPFVVGVMGDFVGNAPQHDQPSVREREFLDIHPDNFDQVMQRLGPGIKLRVPNHIDATDEQLELRLSFNSLRDFEPRQILEQVEPLRRLKQARDRLRELQTCMDRSPKLETLLQATLANKNELQALVNELNNTPKD